MGGKEEQRVMELAAKVARGESVAAQVLAYNKHSKELCSVSPGEAAKNPNLMVVTKEDMGLAAPQEVNA